MLSHNHGMLYWKEIDQFGVDEIQELLIRVSKTLERANVDVDSVISEWQALKVLAYEHDVKNLDWEGFIASLEDEDLLQCRNILLIIDLLLSLPPTSVLNESLFSHTKLTKTVKKARLSTRKLDSQTLVKILTESIKKYELIRNI